MSHVIGKGRYGRETYPGRAAAGGAVPSEFLRFTGGETPASVPVSVFSPVLAGQTSWAAFTQADILEESGMVALPSAYHVASFSVKRVIVGVAGPIIGDDDITYELLQSTDNGATWQNPAGGAAVVATFAPNEEADKVISVNETVPAGALIAIRATYPANYDPQGQVESVFFIVQVT